MQFNEIKKILDLALEEYGIPCSDVMISLNGENIYRYMNGTSDAKKEIPLTGNELYFLYSVGKLITCTAALQLYEKDLLKMDDPLSNYIPEFGEMQLKTDHGICSAKNQIRIKHLFTMTSGLNYDIDSEVIRKQKKLNPDSTTMEMIRAIARSPLEFEAGTHYRYSLSHDVLAAVIEVISGVSFGEYLQKNIFDVCGMENTYVGYDEKLKKHICCQYLYDSLKQTTELIKKENPYILTSNYQSGGAGIVSSTEDYMRFANALINSEKLLKCSTVDLMSRDHLPPVAKKEFQKIKKGYSYGLGVRTNVGNCFSAKGEFGWDGAAGAYVLLDAKHHIVLFYITHVKNRADYLHERLHLELRDTLYRALEIEI